MADDTPSPTPDELLQRAQANLTEITALCEAAKATKAALDDAQRLAATAMGEAQAKATEVATIATQAVAAKTQITDAQAVIASKPTYGVRPQLFN